MPPRGVVRHDGDDSYLVVAADKGTATFSDIANGVAKDYGFWLGDAFASGGSVGYDHKAMGITARGAWVSVQRHFRERGIDCQTEDFTAVGIGDMSGDVFGNGMLCSEHTRLVAAFDHRDIFLDPDPDAATSYAERQRLFDLPRSSWQDYDTRLISEGGGVFPRSLKSIPLNAAGPHGARHRRRRRGDDAGRADEGDPPGAGRPALERRHRHLRQGRRARPTPTPATRPTTRSAIDGRELRARCVGEGGNLGLTQLGRIEYARRCGGGRRINTDFIDNSAGVDTSDHEVNIKILLDRVVARRRPHREAAQHAARRDDRRGRRAGAARQLRAEPRARQRRRQRAVAAARARGLDAHARAATACSTASSRGCRPPRQVRRRLERGEGLTVARAVGAAGLDQDRAGRGAARLRPARRPLPATST